MPFQFNCLHVLPNEMIKVDRLPIELMLAAKTKFYRKNDKQQKDGKKSKTSIKTHVSVHDRDAEATEQDIILLDELNFPHAIMAMKPEQLSMDELGYTYKKLAAFLTLH